MKIATAQNFSFTSEIIHYAQKYLQSLNRIFRFVNA